MTAAEILALLDSNPAEGLRATAGLMRELAEAATTRAQWTGGHYWIEDYDPSDPSGQTGMQVAIGGMSEGGDAAHYSAWSPPVALAVANLLDATAARTEAKVARGGSRIAVWSHEMHALAIARTFLGGQP